MELIKTFRKKLEQEKGKYQKTLQDIENANSKLEGLKILALNIEHAQIIIQQVAQQTQAQLVWYINDMVSASIDSIFPDDEYKFFMEFIQRRGVTEADILLADSKDNRIKPKDADGGGLSNVVAFSLRIALWSLSKATRPVFILDEPFHFLHSSDAHSRIVELLKMIAEKLNVQIIMVTGEDESEEIIGGADKVFKVEKIKGVSKIIDFSNRKI